MLRPGFVSALIAGVLVLVGCGGTDVEPGAEVGAGGSPADVVALAADRTVSESFDVRIETPIAWNGRELTVVASGAFDLAAHRGRLELTPESYAELRDARLVSMPFDLILIDGDTRFTRHPDLADFVVGDIAEQLGGRTWIRSTGSSDVFLPPGVPWQLLGWLRDYQQTVEDLGSEEIDGESLHRYHVAIDFEALQSGEISENTISATGDVWIGAEGLIRRFTVELVSDQGENPDYVSTGIYALSSAGAAVDLALPAETEVVDSGALGTSETAEAVTVESAGPAVTGADGSNETSSGWTNYAPLAADREKQSAPASLRQLCDVEDDLDPLLNGDYAGRRDGVLESISGNQGVITTIKGTETIALSASLDAFVAAEGEPSITLSELIGRQVGLVGVFLPDNGFCARRIWVRAPEEAVAVPADPGAS
jgi:hypothetical protein